MTNTYGSSDTYARFGRVTCTEARYDKYQNGDQVDSQTRTTEFRYYAENSSHPLMLEAEIIEPQGGPEFYLEKRHGYDQWGNRVSTTTLPRTPGANETPNFQARTETTTYTATETRIVTTNALGHTETVRLDDQGHKISRKDPNGLETRWQYDAFDRL